ncbi:MAG: class III signal peptide-containing protein [Candidatus Micrarchaeia archaeon]
MRSNRGQGAFEYLLMLGGVVLIAALVMVIVQGSTGDVNNTLVASSNNYLDRIGGKAQDLQDQYILRFKVPAGCAYSNLPCANNYTCNASNNSCYAFVNTTRNGCAYSNPACPAGYSCTGSNACFPA